LGTGNAEKVSDPVLRVQRAESGSPKSGKKHERTRSLLKSPIQSSGKHEVFLMCQKPLFLRVVL
jgi:hypothetical protein